MRAKMKAELITKETEERTVDYRGRNSRTTVNSEKVKFIFDKMGFDIVTKEKAMESVNFIRSAYNNIADDIPEPPFHIPSIVLCFRKQNCKTEDMSSGQTEEAGQCTIWPDPQGASCRRGERGQKQGEEQNSIDQLISLKTATRYAQASIDDFISRYLEWLKFIFIHHKDKVFPTTPLLSNEEASKSIEDYFRWFLAYLDACAVTVDLPDQLRERELDAWILTGYEDEGQVSFMVTLYNSTSIYIRIKANLFRKMKHTCKLLMNEINNYSYITLFGRSDHNLLSIMKHKFTVFAKRTKYIIYKSPRENLDYIRLSEETPIEVMEPKKEQPTIRGYFVRITPSYLWGKYKTEIKLLAVLLVLIWATMGKNDIIEQIINYANTIDDPKSLHSSIERINTGFIVTFCVSFANLFIKVRSDKNKAPIDWISDNIPMR